MTKYVDCEKCTHFTGRNGWARVEWGCAKGHASESMVTLIRTDGCRDHRAAPRDTLIFRRFKSEVSFHGADGLKGRQAQARRIATGLQKSLSEFGDLMDGDQVKAGRDAVAALNRLADDIERAARMAIAYKAREDQRREIEQQRVGDELATRLLAGWSEAEVIECAQHLAAFDTYDATRWLASRRGNTLTCDGFCTPNDIAVRMNRERDGRQRAALHAELRRKLATVLDTLDRPPGPSYATRADFEAWRQLMRHRRAANASVAAVLSTAAAAARGDQS